MCEPAKFDIFIYKDHKYNVFETANTHHLYTIFLKPKKKILEGIHTEINSHFLKNINEFAEN